MIKVKGFPLEINLGHRHGKKWWAQLTSDLRLHQEDLYQAAVTAFREEREREKLNVPFIDEEHADLEELNPGQDSHQRMRANKTTTESEQNPARRDKTDPMSGSAGGCRVPGDPPEHTDTSGGFGII
jgi:hypothetical protein